MKKKSSNTLHLDAINKGLLDYLKHSPTPFHAVGNIEKRLIEAKHQRLEEKDSWNLNTSSLKAGKKYYLKRNDSSIIAFQIGQSQTIQDGFNMLGTHTDSPCLKVKPQPDLYKKNYHQLGVEIYGGVLLKPWFDRDLSLAGRVCYESSSGTIEHLLLDFTRPIAFVANLAIHLNPKVNEQSGVNKQKEMPPLVQMDLDEKKISFDDFLIKEIKKQKLVKSSASKGSSKGIKKILSHEMFFL